MSSNTRGSGPESQVTCDDYEVRQSIKSEKERHSNATEKKRLIVKEASQIHESIVNLYTK